MIALIHLAVNQLIILGGQVHQGVKYQEMDCKYCQSSKVIKFGRVKGVQRYFCLYCKRKFVSWDTIPKMQTATRTVADVLNMYYEGMSENEIRRYLIQRDGNYVSTGSVYNWVRRFTDLVAQEVSNHVPKVSREWIADESLLKLVGINIWFWDIIDKETRFLIVSKMCLVPNREEAQALMKQAYERTEVIPRVIYTDKLGSYLAGLELDFAADTRRERSVPLLIRDNTALLEGFHATFKKRTRVMHRLRSLDVIRRFMAGWLLHYNYFRPNVSLAGKTPSAAAGVIFPFRNWKDVIEQPYEKTARGPLPS